MEDVQATLTLDVRTGPAAGTVVAGVADQDGGVFAEVPVRDWPDLDRLAVRYGVPQERIAVDAGARVVLDARTEA